LQEFIKKSSGRDIRVIVCGDKVVGGMKRQSNKGYKSNFHQGGSVKKVPVNDELAELAVEAAKAVGLHIAGVDFLIDEDSYKICEINASPGFEGFEKATGINVAEYLLNYALSQCEIVVKKEKKLKKVKVMVEHNTDTDNEKD
jgi:RimK family alpha-L-glutamate ligase